MRINCENLKKSIKRLASLNIENNGFQQFLRLNEFSEADLDKIFLYLGEKLLEKKWTSHITNEFMPFLLLIVTKAIPLHADFSSFLDYQKKCVILSELVHQNLSVLEYSLKFFVNKPAPFISNVSEKQYEEKRKKLIVSESDLTDKDIIKCCYKLLTANAAFFRDIWDWSPFLEKYFNEGNYDQQIYCNKIVAILTDMTEFQLSALNSNIPPGFLEDFDEIEKQRNFMAIQESTSITNVSSMEYDCSNEVVVNIEEVFLPVYNVKNYNYFKLLGENEIIKVDSTKTNLRNIAIGISSGKTICISGPVGCGKTILVEYLAKITGHVYPANAKTDSEFLHEKQIETHSGTTNICISNEDVNFLRNHKRKNATELLNENNLHKVLETQVQYQHNFINRNGFLRIQLGDQTDSKMLLGQYHCTDIPGEFTWSPGVLTQAVMKGMWILLEDIDLATQDTFTILSNMLETKTLSVPGFKDVIKIAPGFQLFVSLRTGCLTTSSQKSYVSLLNKYLYTVNIVPLSKQELTYIVSENYSNLKDIASRMVNMYLNFVNENFTTEFLNSSSNIRRSNTERLVSTRDFIKLCQRCEPTFSKTSTECAFFIFQNAVDLFCSYLQHGPEKVKLIISVGSNLGINPSRCEHYANEYKPDVDLNDLCIKIGRVSLNKAKLRSKRDMNEEMVNKKRLKLGENTEKEISVQITKKANKQSDVFAFTRISVCLLEKVAVCINQNEPVLLVGETGVGKTSCIHYLAKQTNHDLVVINMNNQSDVSDLMGGFRPVDLSYVMMPLRMEFENLFRKTFNEIKNEKFLSNISICYNQGNFDIIIKLILKITESVFEKAKINQNNIARKSLGEWTVLRKKVLRLNSQLKKSANISFAFIPGALVTCIQNGDWILLDEINLATSETLECLSTILEPNGSIILLERGDFSPLERHPNFRIFACMNPSTDIGKKDLPTGIRNRFTEFYVDELVTDYDLTLLVDDYLLDTGIKKAKISNIVKLYKKLRGLSQLELNDGLGNRPVYSLRNLCRALKICSKNLCGSIERNLYESFCLSFLTQLDITSHKVVLSLIREYMLEKHANAVLSQSIPKPGENFLNFGGYWIEKGKKSILECEYYILTESVEQNLKDLARIISIGKLPILLQGPTSAGKTSLIEYIAKKSGNVCLRVNNHEHTDLQEYIGTYVSDKNGKLSFKEGVLVQAMRNGFWIILDELNLASSDILEALNRVLDDNRELFIPETQTIVKAHKNFMLFATQNPPGLYGGRKTLSRAFKNRFVELHFSDIPSNELELILEKRCFIPKSYSKKMVKCMNELQANRKTTTSKNNFTLRDLFRWGNRYTYANKKLLNDNSYDWNQHLVDEGYLVLSGKVRSDIEEQIICDALKNNFKKLVEPKKLFDLNNNTSMATKAILQSLNDFKMRNDIVWTNNMKRMAVLSAKSLEFNEPVLLIGVTGSGKTTICQILAAIANSNLRILNCHMHTEGADFLGGLRPHQEENVHAETKEKQLFEWIDGPLVESMQDGSYFMADEISLAEDSVLERLNSVLEPERSLLLAEKGVTESNIESEISETKSDEFTIKAKDNFKFLATMNPGGDFGKKELSPALRNRFTEIWCKPSTELKDLEQIITNTFNLSKRSTSKIHEQIAKILVKVVFYLKEKVTKFKFSVRDIIAWAVYILKNSKNDQLEKIIYDRAEILVFGLEIIFLDSLEMLGQDSLEHIDEMRESAINFLIREIDSNFNLNRLKKNIRGKFIEFNENIFGINPFYINACKNSVSKQNKFFFEAPTTFNNLFRLLSALSLEKAILLEGPPGVGKTSLIENLAKYIGYKIVRINLCEHTDLADLFGTDLPVEENLFCFSSDELNEKHLTHKYQPGAFKWHNGPLLSALLDKNVWILLDELNLAPQSVLEGLNAILDHRGEVFIPELNKTFKIGQGTKIFACQNPLRQGGGRKGLPQSFLNRFTKVYLRKLTMEDLLHVINNKYKENFYEILNHFEKYLNSSSSNVINIFDVLQLEDIKHKELQGLLSNHSKFEFDLADRMVRFSEKLAKGVTEFEFGFQGGPYEINLRDILRWCESLFDKNTGFIIPKERYFGSLKNFLLDLKDFILVLYERMKLIYCQRMRSDKDRTFIYNAFSTEFNCDVEKLNKVSEDISFYFTENAVYLNDIIIKRDIVDYLDNSDQHQKTGKEYPLILSQQKELLKNLAECVHLEKPVLLCGPVDSGKTKVINLLSDISNIPCAFDNIDDSVTGSFQQVDFNRHFEEISSQIGGKLIKFIQNEFIKEKLYKNKKCLLNACRFLKTWNSYTKLDSVGNIEPIQAVEDTILIFIKRIESLKAVIEYLKESTSEEEFNACVTPKWAQLYLFLLNKLKNIIEKSGTLNSGGYFEWIDSKIVKCLKSGGYICLEHSNLCSSAVLDRLNSVLEPEGQLLISEKGIAVGCTAEVVDKHKNFRVFLTLDPKNGELSRAMRNRCVEVALNKNYTDNDLKKIIFSNGIIKSNNIDAILHLYTRVKNLTDLNNFNVSHLTQLTFLIHAYNTIGFDDFTSIYLAGMDIFVYSSNIDLMGYGLDFYKNQLKDIICEASDMIRNKRDNNINLKNTILTSKNLNCLSLVKLQLEPLTILLNNYENYENAIADIKFLFNEYGLDEFANDELLLKFYIFVIYQTSKQADIKYRYYVIEKLLNKSAKILPVDLTEKLLKLNENLLITFRNEILKYEGKNIISTDLPWNMKIFPRIRTYRELTDVYIKQEFESKLTAHLMYETLVAPLPNKESLNLKKEKITAYNYSYSVNMKLIIDKTNNEFLKNLYVFIKELRIFFKNVAENIDNDIANFVNITLNLLWLTRYQQIADKALFEKNGEPNQLLLNQLYLHFKWIDKVVMKPIQIAFKNTLCDICEVYNVLADHLKKSISDLNILKKYYVKLMTNFRASETLTKLQYDEVCFKFDHLISLIPFYGKFDANTILKKFNIITYEESKKIKSLLLYNNCNELMNDIRKESDDFDDEKQIVSKNESKIQKILQEFKKNQLHFNSFSKEIDFDIANTSIEHINAIISDDSYDVNDIKLNMFDIEMLPLKEYFLNNLFAYIDSDVLNKTYTESIFSLKICDMNFFQILSTSEYRNFSKMWSNIFSCINENEDLITFLNCNRELLKVSDYRKYSTFDQKIQNFIKCFKLSNLKLKFNCCFEPINTLEISCDINYNGPYLVNILNKSLLSIDGDLRQISVKELPRWQNQLNQICELLWFNSKLTDNIHNIIYNFQSALIYSKKLLLEVEFVFNEIKSNILNASLNQNYEAFNNVVKKLKNNIETCVKININFNCEYSYKELLNLEQKTAIMYSLIGSIQLHLLTYLPLVDPIEKSFLKKRYLDEDINHLHSLSNAYNIMSKVMDYKGLAEEYRLKINERLEELIRKKQKYLNKNLEKRPESHLYNKMVQDITHYLNVNGNLNQLISIVSKADKCFNYENDKIDLQKEISECIKVLKVWTLNSQQFLLQISKSYPSYRDDLLYPLECAINIIRFSFGNLQKNLLQLRNSIMFEIENPDLTKEDLCETLEFLTEYPHQQLLSENLQDNLLNILKKISPHEYETLYIRVLKFKIAGIYNAISTSLEVDAKSFSDFSDSLKLINEVWKSQEDSKRKQQIEEESLYVIKTKCENENEEEEDLKSMQELFPVTVNEDFSEFVEINPFENNINKTQTNTKNVTQIDFSFAVKIFMNLVTMRTESGNLTSKNNFIQKQIYIDDFNDKLKLFQIIFDVYKPSLSDTFDSKLLNIFCLIIKQHRDRINNEPLKRSDKETVFNIYKDSNIPETASCVPLLGEIIERVNKQLDLYPEHATLIDILKITKRISHFSIVSPIVRFNTGFQLLRQKISQWNEVAHKNNHMQDLEIRVAEFIQHWTKLELRFWRNCLTDVREKIEISSYNYWFFIYNSIDEFLTTVKEYAEDQCLEKKDETNLNNMMKVFKQFIESSNYGDFSIRLMLLKSFELYLNFTIQYKNECNIEKGKLISLIYNIHLYYEQFSNEIDVYKKNLFTTVKKKLEEIVKIESYNKDLSYFSMKNNIAKVHRNLNKLVKEYEHGLKESITNVFNYKEENMSDLSTNNDKGGKCLRNDPKIKYYMIDVKHFISSQTSKNIKYDNNDETLSNSSSVILNRFEKLFLTSRNVVKELILKINYPNLTSNLEGLLSNYFETYEYLRNLNVDRSQEKSKQIIQNKHFLQQKRKTLSDVFKTLTILGLNYRSGLTEISIKSDLTNMKIKPFSIDNLLLNLSKSKTLNQNFTYLNDNLNLYYAKCAYKMNILQKNLQNPNPDLGPSNIDRIKGFSVDMLSFVQNQRKLLSSSVNVFCQLKKSINNLNLLVYCCQYNNYDELKMNFLELESNLLNLKEFFRKIYIFIGEFKDLLETIPSDANKLTMVFENQEVLIQKSEKYENILNYSEKILQITKVSIAKLKNLSTVEPLNYETIKELLENKKKCLKHILDLQSEFNKDYNYAPIKISLDKLQNSILELDNRNKVITQSTLEIDVSVISTELDNILHISLMAIQNLFKKYNLEDNFEELNKEKMNVIGESEIYKNHLKEKLFKEMVVDFKEFNMKNICSKIENVFIAVKHLNYKTEIIKKISSLIPILDQYLLLGCYYIFQQLGAHKVSTKMLYVMLSAFIELSSKGFCSPPDLIQDEEGKQQQNQKSEGGGFSEENTTGNEKDVSDKIENEDQLEDARRPEDRQNEKNENDKNCEEEKGIEMSDNFDADLQDVDKDQEEDEVSEENDDDNDFEKEMGNTEKGADKLDEQIWGSDNEEKNEDDGEVSDDESVKGRKNENDGHNDLEAPKEEPKGDNESGKNEEQLDSVSEDKDSEEKKQKAKDIDNMLEPELDIEQTNPYHNNLEEPPEAEEMELDDNVNLDEGNDKDKEQSNNLENPFDIDKMKETMESTEQQEELNDDEKNEDNMSNTPDDESDEENFENLKHSEDNEEKGNSNNNEEDAADSDVSLENDVNKKDNEIQDDNNEEQRNSDELYEESRDNASKENNLQTNDTEEYKNSNDQVQSSEDINIEQNQKLDEQETGEEGKGVGQANDDKSEKGHQSITETKEVNSIEKNVNKNESKTKNKLQDANENRTLGERDENTIKNLKTIEKNKDENEKEINEKSNLEEGANSDEFQHIKEPDRTTITAIDNATEEQSKKIQHLSDTEENEEEIDDLTNKDNIEENLDEDDSLEQEILEINSEKTTQETQKSKSKDIKEQSQHEICEEKMEIEGENIDTIYVTRGSDTTSHFANENASIKGVQEEDDTETLQMRKMYYEKLENVQKKIPQTKDFEIWESISSLMVSNARDLCEQLRLILEPTKCTKLKGDYKTGRRINMKKIIPYIASQFRKDKIWLRRTKPSQRDYKITIAIDDSKSMHHNNSKEITLKAISLVSQALTLLESGKLNILSFGESPQIILNHSEQFDGPKLVKSLSFDQNQSKIAELLDFIRTLNIEEGNSSTDNRLFENLLLILSDGRNIFSEGEQKVKNSVKLAKLQRIFIVYIIIDNPENKHSILDIRVPNFSTDKKLSMKAYLDTFPFPYYVIVRDLDQLPLVLSEAMRQWFELVNSEQ
ncbi:midasin [Condylostylus longicornis]|uniref:midasin n=1 Tax=Condylostylus longicornis TaxID=2530218 RepID=UPI00244DE29C|nr:midasin [Condylostylus longicornis]